MLARLMYVVADWRIPFVAPRLCVLRNCSSSGIGADVLLALVMVQLRPPTPAMDLRTLSLTDEIIDVSATRALLHWDATGQYSHDQLRHFIHTACLRMELDLLCLLSAMLYMDRLRARFPDAGASSCAKRVLSMGLMTASKYHKV